MEPVEAGRRWRGYALALTAAACWAMGGLTAKWLFTAPGPSTSSWPVPPLGIIVDPAALAGARALAAGVLLAAVLGVIKPRLLAVRKGQLPFLLLFGIAGLAMVHFTYFKTISLTNVATAILLEYLAPVLVLIISVAFLGHVFSWRLPVAVAMSVAGCALVVGAFGGGLLVTPAGIAWGLASAGFFASYSLLGGYAARRFESPWTPLVWGLGFAAIFWMVLLGPGPILRLFATPSTALAVVAVAVIATIIPFGAFLTALRYIPPTNATVTSTVEPVIAAAGAWLLFGESLTFMQVIGGALVIVAIAVVQLPEPGSAELPPGQ